MSDQAENAEVVEVYFDGLCLPKNPGGVPCYAFLIKKRGEPKILHSASGVAADPLSAQATNNFAEYTALIKALEWLDQNKRHLDKIEVKGDSQLVIKQMNGQFRVKSKQLIPLFQKAASLRKKFKDISVTWVPRELNKEADKLTEQAYNTAVLEDPYLLDKLQRNLK